MIDVLGVAMGIDMQGFSRPEGSDELPPSVVPQSFPSAAASSPPKQTSPPTPSPPAASSLSNPSAHAEDVTMQDAESEEEDEDAQAKKEAEAEKKLGTEAYKKRDMAAAERHFAKAWDLWPNDVTFLTNLSGEWPSCLWVLLCADVDVAAAYFEQGEYDKAIEACEKAVDQGRSVRY